MLVNILHSVVLVVHLSLAHRVVLQKEHNSSHGRHGSSKSTFKVAKPSITQARWLDYEVGASIHFNMQTFDKSMKRGTLNNYSFIPSIFLASLFPCNCFLTCFLACFLSSLLPPSFLPPFVQFVRS